MDGRSIINENTDKEKTPERQEPHPGYEECLKMLRDYGTPPHVIAHCQAVACVALSIGKALDDKGYRKPDGSRLDLGLVQSAGMLHDIARIQEKHWEVAADMLEEKNLHQEAVIVRTHMYYPHFSPADRTNETDLVCLGDRVVLENHYAGIERRMDYIIEKSRRHGRCVPEDKLASVRKEVNIFINGLEEMLGNSLSYICRNC